MLLNDLISNVEVLEITGSTEISIKGIAYDSRLVQPGFLFVAIKGFSTDGHFFIENATDRQAAAIVYEMDDFLPSGVTAIRVSDSRKALADLAARFYGYPVRKLNIVGITGTNGKTTTSYLVSQIYKAAGQKTGIIGTIANCIGDKVYPVSHTTPESLDLQQLFGTMVDEGVKTVVMEVSSHALALGRVRGVEFNAALFTNLTQDHLDFHKTMENYLKAKTLLFESLNKTVKQKSKIAVLNADDQASEHIARQSGGTVFTYGINNSAFLTAKNVNVRPEGVAFTAKWDRNELNLDLKLTGLFNVYNTLAAFALGLAEGFDLQVIKEALESVEGVPGRFELVKRGQDFIVVVDYAHTPDGLLNVLKTARQITRGRLITVFGCGGDRDRTKRPVMGEIAVSKSDIAILTSDNPRTEDPEAIIAEVEEGIKKVNKANYLIEPDRTGAINRAISMALPGDVVLIAGKGHETYQVIGTTRYPYDDREVAAAALDNLLKNK